MPAAPKLGPDFSFQDGQKVAWAGVNSSRRDMRYYNAPCAIFCMFERERFVALRPDFLPTFALTEQGKAMFKRKLVADHDEARVWQMRVGTRFNCDTGWQLPLIYNKHKIKSFLLEHEDNLEKKQTHPPFETWFYEERPFIVHAGTSRTVINNKIAQWQAVTAKML